MSKSGSPVAGIIVSVLIIAAVASLGYFQFVVAPTLTASSSTTPTSNQSLITVRINITIGAATKGASAYAPSMVKLVIGKNNSVAFYNIDIQGGVPTAHTATARVNGANGKPLFDTGLLTGGNSAGPFEIDTPGNYSYYCTVHPTMSGIIVVVKGA